MAFSRMDRGTVEDWTAVSEAVDRWQSTLPERIKTMLRQLQDQVEGYRVSQLEHCLQTATRAERAGSSEEMIVAALCHDMANAISIENHAAVAAEILKPYVSQETYEIILTHQDFQGRYYGGLFGMDPEARRRYENEPWYEKACRFSDEWDQTSFDPAYDMLPLEHFEPMIDRIFTHPKQTSWIRKEVGKARRWVRIQRWVSQHRPVKETHGT
jgi:predicted HD phosphohydrolase